MSYQPQTNEEEDSQLRLRTERTHGSRLALCRKGTTEFSIGRIILAWSYAKQVRLPKAM